MSTLQLSPSSSSYGHASQTKHSEISQNATTVNPSSLQQQPGPSTWASKPSLTEDQRLINQVAEKFATSLAADHAAVLHPNVDAPFSSVVDVVGRLLPYHVFQQPKDDLMGIISRKGKRKADLVAEEIADTRFALECYKRQKALKDRMHKLRIKVGKRALPLDQGVALAHVMLDDERTETAQLNAQLRAARAEFDRRKEREKKAAAPPSANQPASASSNTTPYHGYTYTYAQQSYTAAATAATNQPASQTAPQYAPFANSAPIPVQLPMSSLPALHALGIFPIPASSISAGQSPTPPAVLKGANADGTLLNLEINVSLLHSAQMNGLATMLSSLVRGSAAGSARPPNNTNADVKAGT